MKTVTLNIEDQDFVDLGLEPKAKQIDYEDLVQKIKAKLAKEGMLKSLELAKKAGLSDLTIDEINAEIDAVRNAKSNS
ncbi:MULTISPECIES: hypothetical protein [Phaeodactylibacter]|jgi:hypothetical protein|uniref:Uncharacterized protein n=1 Tax=Phaeodactylibacter xiamenensis TaxID=1524460 RepID=A0A098SBC4_9BACT|nr:MULTISPECIES: hypothetical protein [Phaeodactylibacter]KGE89471.1 hypothetical protein IX84_02500 [Phaeodactylibacter xiamenensis]MCI4648633.1 hypothetical protein [Phaeodactylibacter sp.]MCI5091214.1 hypothetical protein [Phaeodactylibacter sp.]MCR9053108.1 hypothetical protein [bacterium]